MTTANDNHGWGDVTTGEDPFLTREVDFPTLGRMVTEEAERFSESAEDAYVGLATLCDTYEHEDPVAVLNDNDEIPRSDDELVTQLNGIAATAYRLARMVRPLAERRTAYFVGRADAQSRSRRGMTGGLGNPEATPRADRRVELPPPPRQS